jgi:hypothetical protein
VTSFFTHRKVKEILFVTSIGAGILCVVGGGGWALCFFRCLVLATEIETGCAVGAILCGLISTGTGAGNYFYPDQENNSSN